LPISGVVSINKCSSNNAPRLSFAAAQNTSAQRKTDQDNCQFLI
ncbi:MAG: hypothetical protein ACI95C_002246, partial [Pseudohongiellaceae bacterium]